MLVIALTCVSSSCCYKDVVNGLGVICNIVGDLIEADVTANANVESNVD